MIGLAFIALVGAIFLVVYVRSGIDDALKAWGAIGTIVGVVVGAIPTYFFGAAATQAAQKVSDAAQEQLSAEQQRRTQLEDKVALLAGTGGPQAVAAAKDIRPDLF